MGYNEDDGRSEVNRQQDRRHEQFREVVRRQQKRHEQTRKMAASLIGEGFVPVASGLYGDSIAPAVEVGSPPFATTEYQFEAQPQESINAKAARLVTEILESASDPTAVEMAVNIARDPYLADEDKLTLLTMLEAQLRE